MACDLVHFHFNPVKTGQIIKQLFLDRGMSMSALAKKTGITYDTLDNVIRGRVQDIKFECLFKICCVLGTPIEVLMLLMMKDEDVDFADQILLYDNRQDEAIPATDIDSVPSSVPDTVIAVAEAVAATDKPLEQAKPAPVTEEYVAFLQDHIKRLTALLELSMRRDVK